MGQTTGIGACCARAASGHAAAPPSAAISSRRLIVTGMWPPVRGLPSERNNITQQARVASWYPNSSEIGFFTAELQIPPIRRRSRSEHAATLQPVNDF
jgi:hypothetical protein